MPRRPSWLIRLGLAIVRLVSVVVPRRDRDAWRREWDAELLSRESTFASDLRVTGHAMGSIADAAWLRRQFTRDSDVVHDVRHGLRLIRNRPAFFLFAAAILGIGIGSTAAVVTLMDRLVVRALPFPDPDQLVSLWQRNAGTGDLREEVAPGNFLDWRAQATSSFEGLAASAPYSVDYTGGARPEVLLATQVTEGFFDLIRVRPLHGRLLHENDHRAAPDRVAVISHGFWERLGGDPLIVGRSIPLDGAAYTVVGVLPPHGDLNLFDGRDRRDVFLPKVFEEFEKQRRGSGWWAAIGRLKTGVTRDQAQAELDAVSARLAQAHPNTNGTTTVGVERLETHLTRTVRPALAVMLGAAVLVLVIACANVASLMLIRGAEREREFAVRGALGAGRGRLLRQLLTESGLVAAGGTVAGVGIAWLTLRAVVALSPIQSARLDVIALDWGLVLTAAIVGVMTTMLAGLVPAIQVSRRTRVETGEGRGGTATRRTRAIGDVLAVAEIGVAVVLAVLVGLLLRSFAELVRVDPGFARDRLAVVQVFAWDRHNSPEKLTTFVRESTERLLAVPGVTRIGAASAMPFMEANINIETAFAVEGRPPAARGEEPTAFLTIATPGYFEVMRTPVLAGRALAPTDDGRAQPVAVVTRALASRHWPQADAVGSYVTVRFQGRPRRVQVVGVMGDLRHDSLELPARPELFLPFAQVPFGSMTFVLEAAGDPARVVEPAKAAVWSVDPLQTIYDSGTVAAMVSGSVAPRRFALSLTGAYALVALFLAALGIYGVMSASTRQRTREIGVRLALGAEPRDVGRLVVRRGVRLAAIGVAAGLAVALVAGQLLRNQLFQVQPMDPVTFAFVAALVVAVAALASSAPARRATKVDPIRALRE